MLQAMMQKVLQLYTSTYRDGAMQLLMSGTRRYFMDLQLEKEIFHLTNFMLFLIRELRES
jgi:hypothetical protein